MLFLAVFCGFLAEYQLEHKIEKERGKQFMESLLEDLHKDTVDIKLACDLAQSQKELLDSVIEMVNTQSLSGEDISTLYKLHANSGRIINATFETRTSSQLKNAAGMRLIRKKVADSILVYWKSAEVCNDISARLEVMGTERHNLGVRIFHNKYYIRSGESGVTPVIGIKAGVNFINDDPKLFAEYSNRAYSRRGVLLNYLNRLRVTKEKAVALMETIRKGYRLK